VTRTIVVGTGARSFLICFILDSTDNSQGGALTRSSPLGTGTCHLVHGEWFFRWGVRLLFHYWVRSCLFTSP